MKVSFSIPLKPLSGKHNFAIRLAGAFERLGVSVTDKKPHINLVFLDGIKKGCKNIYRLDGVLMNTSINYKKKNAILLKAMKQCEGIVYQNEFCKQASDVFIKKFSNSVIINNGASKPDGISPYGNRKPYVLTLSRWRPHKRLKDTVNGFLLSDLHKTHNLIVLGDPDYKVDNESIIYAGIQKSDSVWKYILGADFVVHLAYVDWCPNSVVESLVCGKKVLHSSVGGTKYVVKGNGVSVEDEEWDFNPIDLLNVPSLNMDKLISGYMEMQNKVDKVDAGYLDIHYIAQKYIDYCKVVLG